MMKKASNKTSVQAKKVATEEDSVPQLPSTEATCPIIAIGASAGGLEAIEKFLRKWPSNGNTALVFIQHLDPNHNGMLCELLQNNTTLKVLQITERTVIQPNHVYVIPPGFDLSILHGTLHLIEPLESHGTHLPIDYFLRSLAADKKQDSIGVILSGMGSDGTLGLRALKEQGGATFVQSPTDAKFDGMPRSAIDAGLADIVAPIEELVQKVISFIEHRSLTAIQPEDNSLQSGIEKIIILLRAQTGHDFSLYKKSTIHRRVERRMALHQFTKIFDYVRYLRANPQEGELVFKELLIGVTNFFRDSKPWDQLQNAIIPSLFATHPKGGILRAWVPACSTGEEAYSLAIAFREALQQTSPDNHFSLQVFATDLDSEAIDAARRGVYSTDISKDIPETYLRKYFVEEKHGYLVTKEIREMVIFAPQNLIMDPPFTKLDILSCRNLMIYLESELQKKLIRLFHYCLNPGGVLVLGSAETVSNNKDLFSPYPGKTRIYQRQETMMRPDMVEFPSAHSSRQATDPEVAKSISTLSPANDVVNLKMFTEAILLQQFTPAAVLTNNKGDIVYINGKTGKYLEPAAGKVNNNLFAMAREGLVGPLNESFNRAVRLKKAETINDVRVGTNGGTKLVDVSVQPLSEPEALCDMVLVVFTGTRSSSSPSKKTARAKENTTHSERMDTLAKELQQSREELQTTREEMQTSQEELKSTNEELQSTNEELQSTNEELTTSKEEMQSMNEELQTVNHELSAKVEDLSKASDDMKNLLNSTEIATLFLDNELRVRRFTAKTTNIFKLIPGDAGRPISDLVSTLEYPTLLDDVKEVLRSLVFHQVEVRSVDDKWYLTRIMPYRTQDNRIDGVVITFSDITEFKLLESTLREMLDEQDGDFEIELAGAQDKSQKLMKVQQILERHISAKDKKEKKEP